MSHRIHGNHHPHTHQKHKLEEHAWVKHLQDKGFLVLEATGHHEKHTSLQEKYQVFRFLADVADSGKELIVIDDYGDVVDADASSVAGFPVDGPEL